MFVFRRPLAAACIVCALIGIEALGMFQQGANAAGVKVMRTEVGRIETGTAIANCAFGDDGRTRIIGA